MKKQVYYMIAVALTLGLGACTNNELETESEVAQQDGHVTITARIANAASTRVSIDGLDLSWNEGDRIGILYINGNNYLLEPFIYKMGSNGVAVFESENTISDEEVQGNYALYPYNDESHGLPDYFMFSYACEAESPTKVNLPLFGTWDSENEEFAFQAAGSLLAVTVKNLPAGYTEAKLETSQTNGLGLQGTAVILYQMGWYYLEPNENISQSITYSLSNDTKTDQTLYFPIPSKEALERKGIFSYEGTKFTLSGDGMTSVGFTIGSNFAPEKNKKYTKVIVFDEDGNRSTDPVALANANLEVSNSASADLSSMYPKDPTFLIPQNKKEGNEETVTLSLSGFESDSSPNITYVKEGEAVEGKVAAANVDIDLKGDPYAANITIDLPSSKVTLGGYDDGKELSALYVYGAKTITTNGAVSNFIYKGSSEKVVLNNTVEVLYVKGNIDNLEVNDNVRNLTAEHAIKEMGVNATIENFTISGMNNEMTLTFGATGFVSNPIYVMGTIKLTVVNQSEMTNPSDCQYIEIVWGEDSENNKKVIQTGTTTLTFVDGVLQE
jgi:hypothetical protein